jgi:predicted ATPase
MNLRSFPNTTIKFSRGINLLVGNNNSGKSTVIKALYKMQDIQTFRIEDIRKTKERGIIQIDLQDISTQDCMLFAVNHKGFIIPQAKAIKVCMNLFTGPIEVRRGAENLYFDLSKPYKEDKLGRIILDKDNCFTDFVGFPKNETQNNFIYPFFAKRKTNYYSIQNLGERESFGVSDDLRTITSKIQNICNPSHPKSKEFVRNVKHILGFEVGVIPHGENQSNTGIFLKPSVVVPIESMGEGVVNVLGLIVLLLTEDHKLYLIEELENDIHPAALKKLLQLIIEKSRKNQFVISTHSNIVVKYLGVDGTSIFHFIWKAFEKTAADKLPTSEVHPIANEPQSKLALLESLGYDLMDFELYKAYMIFEESSAESIVKNFLIPTFCPKLSYTIKTVAASGASDVENRFHNLLSLFLYVHQNPVYHSRAWAIADGDEAGRRAIDSLRKRFKTWAPEQFIALKKKNFENYYPPEFENKYERIKTSPRHLHKEQKAILTKEVLEWVQKNPRAAKQAFEKSAKEIIQLLKKIETTLK